MLRKTLTLTAFMSCISYMTCSSLNAACSSYTTYDTYSKDTQCEWQITTHCAQTGPDCNQYCRGTDCHPEGGSESCIEKVNAKKVNK